MDWTEDRVSMLRDMWTDGKSASQIAEALGGISRNAVIGKAHRLGLQKRPSPIKRSAGATILTLTERMCRWPVGHPGDEDFHFCGKKTAPGMPYCAEHCAIAYQQPQSRRGENKQQQQPAPAQVARSA